MVVFAGEPVIVGEDVRVTIDCSPQIDVVAAKIGMAPIVRWYKDGTISHLDLQLMLKYLMMADSV